MIASLLSLLSNIDPFSRLLLIMINSVGALIIIYSLAYMRGHERKALYYSLYLIMVAAMNGVVLSTSLFSLFICLEIASLATYLLVAHDGKKLQFEAALKYLVMGTVASIAILAGIALLFSLCRSLEFTQIARSSGGIALRFKAFITVLFVFGFGMKAALVPFHAWLPDAHTSAPSPVSATLSGVLIKVLGVYAIVRVLFNLVGVTYGLLNIFAILGIASILLGGFAAYAQNDIKRMLAYSSISQIGYIFPGLGLGTPFGILGAVLHMFSHSFFKSLLFLCTGSIEYSTKTRDMRETGGLAKKMPWTYWTSLFGSLSASGIPPFSGFWSKLFIVLACVQLGKIWFAAAAIFGSILTLAYLMKFQKNVFFGELPRHLNGVKEAPFAMVLPMAIEALACLAIGLFIPFLLNMWINPAAMSVVSGLMLYGGR